MGLSMPSCILRQGGVDLFEIISIDRTVRLCIWRLLTQIFIRENLENGQSIRSGIVRKSL